MTKSFNKESPIGEMDRQTVTGSDQPSQSFIDTRSTYEPNKLGGPPDDIRLTLTVISDPWSAAMWVSQRSLLTVISKYGVNFDNIEFRVGMPEEFNDDHVTIDDQLGQLLPRSGTGLAALMDPAGRPDDMHVSARALAAVTETAPHRSLTYLFYLQHAAFLKGLDIENPELPVLLAEKLNINSEPIVEAGEPSSNATDSIDSYATLPKLIVTREGPDEQITRELSGAFLPADISTTCKEFGFDETSPSFWKYYFYDKTTISHILALSALPLEEGSQ